MSNINIVLFEPEIPPNTANIIRTCVATNSKLHLIHPLGFDLKKDYKVLKRSSTNYIDQIELNEYQSLEEFLEKNQGGKFCYITRYGEKNYHDIDYNETKIKKKDIFLVFGKESTGLPDEFVKENYQDCYRIPMSKEMRSLNLSNCVALCTYDLLIKDNFSELELKEPHKSVVGEEIE